MYNTYKNIDENKKCIDKTLKMVHYICRNYIVIFRKYNMVNKTNTEEENTLKKFFAIILALALILSLAACAGNSSPTTQSGAKDTTNKDAGKKTIRIAWCDDTQDSTRAKVLQLLNERIAEINGERADIEVTLDYYDANKTVDKQISDVETACLTKPDVFIFSCVDSEGSKVCLDMMKQTGAHIIDIRDMGSDIPDVIFYSSDENTYANATSSWIVDYMNNNPDKLPLQVGLVYGAAAQTLQLKRCDLVKELAAQYPDKIEIIAEANADWDTQKAMSLMEDWIQAYPQMNFVVCANDIMALGVSNALVSAGIKDEVIVTGIDLDGGAELIAQGKQDLDVGAALAVNQELVDISVALVEGKYEGDRSHVAKGVMGVDATNVEQYLAGNTDACLFAG